ncbi:MAG: efflux RND transporter periplasmic adaptor subunit [Nitrospirae bacterium]|nr:efflux RND transporter periplasmic adaptor subunit [Nitrospirota bacterium]
MIKLIFTLCSMLLTLLFLILCGCNKTEETKSQEHILNVQVEKAVNIFLKPYVEATGTLAPFERVTVSSELDGILSKTPVDEGALVSKGALLAKIDDADYALELNRSQLALEKALATRKNAEAEFVRKESLYKEQLVTKQQFDDISTTVLAAKADFESSKAALSIMRQRLSKTTILSPLTGAVEAKKVSSGDFVRVGSPMFIIIQTNPLKLRFTVSEREVAKLKSGLDVTFTVSGFPGRQFKGRLCTIYPNLDEKTRSLAVEAIVDNADAVLKPGFYAKLRLYTGQGKTVTAIPSTSIVYEAGAVKVFIREGETAKEKYIETGQSFSAGNRDMVEAVSGLSEGQEVVTVGQQGLLDGAKIKAAALPEVK